MTRAKELAAALRELEEACDAVAALRTPEIYCAMIAVPGTAEALLRLDAARRQAREATKRKPGSGRPPRSTLVSDEEIKALPPELVMELSGDAKKKFFDGIAKELAGQRQS